MTKDLTFHINNKAYTISGDEELEKELCYLCEMSNP